MSTYGKNNIVSNILLIGFLVGCYFIYKAVFPGRDQEMMWEAEFSEMTGAQISIGRVKKRDDGGYTFQNIEVMSPENFYEGGVMVEIPKLEMTLKDNNQHISMDIFQPKFNHYQYAQLSAGNAFNKEIQSYFTKNKTQEKNKVTLEFQVYEPEMEIFYAQGVGSKYTIAAILNKNPQQKNDSFSTFVTMPYDAKAFKLRAKRGNLKPLAVRVSAYFVSVFDGYGRKALAKIDSKRQKENEKLRTDMKKSYDEARKRLEEKNR